MIEHGIKFLKYFTKTLYQTAHIKFYDNYAKVKAPEWNREFIKAFWSEQSPYYNLLKNNPACLEDASRIITGQMRIYDKLINFTDEQFSWHKDILSGREYPRKPYCLLRLSPNNKDHVVSTWELSMLHFIPTLIGAHINRNESRFPAYFEKVLDDWIADNPLHIGVNWYCALDIAVRAFNMLLGVTYFGPCLKREEFYRKVLWAHIEYVYKTDLIKKCPKRNNHYLIAVAMLTIMANFFEGPKAELIANKAFAELCSEMLVQFRDDGGNFESSTGYHQMSLEAILPVFGMCGLKESCRFDSKTKDITQKACGLIKDYMRAYGQSPHFGDSCDGRIFVFENYYNVKPYDHSFIEKLRKYFISENTDTEIGGYYPQSGYGFRSNRRYGICLNCSPVDPEQIGGRGHTHCDKTSFVLQIDGQPIFVDSGTCCYIADIDKRFKYRSTKAHNLVVINDREQCGVNPKLCFGPLNGINTSLRREQKDGITIWQMEHDGYSTAQEQIKVSRKVMCCDDYLQVTEAIDGRQYHKIDILWHVHPQVALKFSSRQVELLCNERKLGSVQVPAGFETIIRSSSYSPSFGLEIENKQIIFRKELKLPVEINYKIICSA